MESETVRQGRLKLENKNFGIPPPWRDDLEAVGRDSQWMKQCPTMDGWTPPIADGSDVPDPENSDDLGRPTPWDPAPERPAPPPAAAPSPTPAPAARAAVPTLPAMSTADFTADSTWGDSAEPKLLREMLRKPYEPWINLEFTNRTNIVRNLILDLQKHPRNLYIKMPAVPPFDPNGRSYEVCIEFVFYLLMGLAGYVSFRGFTEQDFILNYRNDDMMMFSVRCIYGIVVCLGAPINLSPAASSIQGLLGSRGDRRRHFMVVTSIIETWHGSIASCVAIALWCKQVADVIGLIGASFGSLIVLAWPAMIYRKALFVPWPGFE
eukprot:s124_g13.t1